jgi:hypothetical protein
MLIKIIRETTYLQIYIYLNKLPRMLCVLYTLHEYELQNITCEAYEKLYIYMFILTFVIAKSINFKLSKCMNDR